MPDRRPVGRSSQMLQFSKYFVEKCDVSVDLFEGRLASLLRAVEALSGENHGHFHGV
jgi:hypothetical protein